MDVGMQERKNAKPEKDKAAETGEEVYFRVLTVHTPGIETYMYLPCSREWPAGRIGHGYEECGRTCIFKLPTAAGKHFSHSIWRLVPHGSVSWWRSSGKSWAVSLQQLPSASDIHIYVDGFRNT